MSSTSRPTICGAGRWPTLPQAYLPQLALYASALERAVGGSPVPGLMFLRTGDVYLPPPADLAAALAAIRDSIDHGGLLDTQGHDRDHGT